MKLNNAEIVFIIFVIVALTFVIGLRQERHVEAIVPAPVVMPSPVCNSLTFIGKTAMLKVEACKR